MLNNKGNTGMHETQSLPGKSLQSNRGYKTMKQILINNWQNKISVIRMLTKSQVLTTYRASLFEESILRKDKILIYKGSPEKSSH